jgi:hypothetical protein
VAPEPDPPLSAQVILSDVEVAPACAEYFGSAGFEAGPLVGSSFAISGARERFEESFGSAAAARLAEAERPAELPLDRLPDELAAAIEAVAVSGPPDFGPP